MTIVILALQSKGKLIQIGGLRKLLDEVGSWARISASGDA